MPAKEESLGKITSSTRLDVMHQMAERRAANFGVGMRVKKPDAGKLGPQIDKVKRAEYVFAFDGMRLRLEIRVGSGAVELGSVDFGAEKDLVRRRALLQAVRDCSSLVSAADLAAFDKAHPPPPDPKKLAALRAKVEAAAQRVARLRSDRDSATYNSRHYDDMDSASSAEFEAWAKGKGAAFHDILFVGSIDAHDPPGFVVIKCLRKGAENEVALPVPMLAAIVAANRTTGGGKVDFGPARRHVLARIDADLLAPYNKEKKAALDKQIAAELKAVRPLAAELKALTESRR